MAKNTKRRLRIFISYSREDESIVEPVVKLLRVTESKLFLDVDSIAPGEKWEEEIARSLSTADKVCVFWCQHSASSEWVNREWRYAHELQKKIIPLLLDSTPVENELAKYQFIDFRFVEGSTHPTVYLHPRSPFPPSWSPRYRWDAERIVKQLLPLIEE